MGWALDCTPRGCWFVSWSGHMPGVWARTLAGCRRQATDWCFSPSFSPSLLLSLKQIHKIFKKFFLKKTHSINSKEPCSSKAAWGCWGVVQGVGDGVELICQKVQSCLISKFLLYLSFILGEFFYHEFNYPDCWSSSSNLSLFLVTLVYDFDGTSHFAQV